MKTITIKQPWAHLICTGIKDIENRTWKTSFRGRVLIHASAKNEKNFTFTQEQSDALESINENQKFINSSIIGSVEIVDCVINHPSIWAEKGTVFAGYDKYGWSKHKPIYNWILANPIMFFESIPAKGNQGFWNYPNILSEQEEKDGELFCHCQIPVKEENQVTGDSIFGYYCRYCGGKWYK